jgi:flagellar biosynthesis protein FlhF
VEPDLQSEVNELKDLVKNLAGRLSDMAQSAASSPPVPAPRQLKVKTGEGPRHHNGAIHGDRILTMLVEKGINVETARTIAGFLRESLTERELSSEEVIAAAIKDTIRDLIQVDPPFAESIPDRKCIALVGPTGVGKTTTLAKIAASFLASGSSSVALITIDTYRIAAVEQLKVYGEIMDLPVDVVITPEQLQLSLQRHRDKDLILIDTAGRSPRDRFCIQELQAFFPQELQIDKHLVLSATTREYELLDTIERFQELGISHTIFTKIDECANLGILLNVQIQNPNPLSYLANGQRVPEDLLAANPKLTAELIMNPQQGSMHD